MSEHEPHPLPSTAPLAASLAADQGESQPPVSIGVATIRRHITGVQVELEKLSSQMKKAKREGEANESLTLLRQRGALEQKRTALQNLLDNACR